MRVLLGLGLALLAAGQADAFMAYVSNEKSNTVSVIDTSKWAVVRTIKVGQRPRGIEITKDENEKVGGNLKSEVTGNANLKAQQYTVEAGSSMTVKGVSVTVEASASLTLKGATVDIQGSGPVNIKGAIINLG